MSKRAKCPCCNSRIGDDGACPGRAHDNCDRCTAAPAASSDPATESGQA